MNGMRRLAAWGLLLSAIWLALSFATYDPIANDGGASNLGGPVGKFLAATLVEAFGVGAFVLCFYLALIGYLVQVGRGMTQIPVRLIGLGVCVLTFGALWQAFLPGRAFPGGSAPIGGVIGDEIVLRMNGLLGAGFTIATMAIGGLAGLLLATDTLIPDLIRGSGSGLAGDAPTMRQRLARRLEATIGSGASRGAVEEDEDDGASKRASKKTDAKAKAAEKKKADAAKARKAKAAAAAKARLEEEDEEPEEELGEDEEWEYEEEEGEEEEEEEDEEWEEEDEELEEEEDIADEPADAPLPAAPKIRQAAAPVNADGIEVIKLKRDPAMKGAGKYPLPPLSLLAEPTYVATRESDAILKKKAAALEQALVDFKVKARVAEIERGPVITRFDLILERGTKISRVTGLADDLALALGVRRVRIAPVKGKSALGVEIPNKSRETVFLRELAVSEDLTKRKIAIPLFLGKDASGTPIIEDLATTPHLLIAGRTGAGKSVFVNDLILSILLTRYPEECRLIMIDPKKVELEVYQDIPHLLTKVESSAKKANKILEWAVNQMEERYELLAATGVRHLTSYNKLGKKVRREKLLRMYPEDEVAKLPEHLPYIVIIVDELADLMMVSGKEVEQSIARLAQKARAVGIHVVLATQRPSTDVITGLIKSNLPARIAFQTRTGIDSRTILDRYGAEKLLDKGDMLYLSSTSDDPRRVQGPFVSDEEVEAVVDYLKKHAGPMYTQNLEQVQSGGGEVASILDQDELFEQAVDVMFASGMASASGLQRRLKVGYARASRLIDLMGDAGIVSEHRGSKAREILMTPEQWEELRQGARKAAGV